MIMAMDTNSRIFACLTQVNTDSKVMGVYINELIKTLNKQDVNWRKSHILLVDGAKYHQSTNTFNVLKQLKVPIMILSPHSYNAAPIEMLFSAIKSNDMNPE